MDRLLGLQRAVLLPPPIIGVFAHTDLADRVGNILALPDQYIELPLLRDNLFRPVPFLWLISPP
jgi:hypothetical protein